MSLLHIAAQNDYVEVLECLLSHVKSGDNRTFFSPPRQIINIGTSYHLQNWLSKLSCDGFSALHYASFNNSPRAIDILIGYGADAGLRNA
jgi:ankyrin repeat protein